MSGTRRAALVVHTLGAEDRAWLLSRLPVERRAMLDTHLAELDELGVPRERGFVDLALAARPDGNAAARLAGASAAEVHAAIGDEPVGVLARVLACRDWPWGPEFIALLPVEQQLQLEAARPRQLAPRLSQALIEVVAQRLGEPAPLPALRHAWAAARRWVLHLKRGGRS